MLADEVPNIFTKSYYLIPSGSTPITTSTIVGMFFYVNNANGDLVSYDKTF